MARPRPGAKGRLRRGCLRTGRYAVRRARSAAWLVDDDLRAAGGANRLALLELAARQTEYAQLAAQLAGMASGRDWTYRWIRADVAAVSRLAIHDESVPLGPIAIG